MNLNMYLSFDGTCEEAMRFYERVLGGRMLMMMRMSDEPGGPGDPATAHLIMHARLQVGAHYLMASDAPGRYTKPTGFSANVTVDDPAEAERIFRELSDGGTILMPIQETFWAIRFGMLTDRFGTPWMVNCEKRGAVPEHAGTAADGAGSDAGGSASARKPFAISRVLDAPRAAVWKAFTDPAEMRKWWGPKGIEIAHSAMDLRPGGTYHYAMKSPDGSLMWGRMVYREIQEPSRLHFVSGFSDEAGGLTRHPMAPQWPLEMLSTFEFAEQDGKTTFTVTWLPLDPTPEEQAAFDAGRASMTGGWTGTLDKLEAYLAGAK